MEGPMQTPSTRDDPAAGISSPGVFSYVVSSSESASTPDRLKAILEADSAEAAVQRVREVVGDDFEVDPAEPVGQPGSD
jgi:hypothetical protein